MRKRWQITLLAALLIAIVTATAAGCGSQAASADAAKLSRETYESIGIGAGSDQLKSIAGEPAKTETQQLGGGHAMSDGGEMGSSMAVEQWYYQGEAGWVRFEITDGNVSAKAGY